MKTVSAPRLGLFLSRATPLARWHKAGILGRETAIYRKLSERLGGVSIVTCGGKEELQFKDLLCGAQILYNRWGLSPNAYSLLAPVLHGKKLRALDIYKSNQFDGAWTPIIAGRLYKKPVILRAGYMWAELHRMQSDSWLRKSIIDKLQQSSLRHATRIVVTTEVMKRTIVERYDISAEKISVISNYVDTEVHMPDPTIERRPGSICYVGRLTSVKNLTSLIEALEGVANVSLALIGEGEQHEELGALAQRLNVETNFTGILPNERISSEINRSELFVLPSHAEGHPKVVLEAMSCGATVLGSDVPGIRELVVHGENGWLFQPGVQSLREAIIHLLGDRELRRKLGTRARDFVCSQYSLDRVCEQELQLLGQLCQA